MVGSAGRGTAERLSVLTPEVGVLGSPRELEKRGKEFLRKKEGPQRVGVFRAEGSGEGGATGGSREGGVLDTTWRSF